MVPPLPDVNSTKPGPPSSQQHFRIKNAFNRGWKSSHRVANLYKMRGASKGSLMETETPSPLPKMHKQPPAEL